MELVGYIVSLVMGLTLGLLGGGGSIITVPILVYLFSYPPSEATGYSLLVVGSTALIGNLTYLRRGEVDFRVGFTFALPSILGVYVTRGWIIPNLPQVIWSNGNLTLTKDLLIMLAFAVVMVFASISMIRARKVSASSIAPVSAQKRFLSIGLKALGVGVVTGFVGAGGGFLIVPSLVLLAGLSMRIAVGTSLMVIAINSLVGFLLGLSKTVDIPWQVLITITGIAICGILVGSGLAQKIPEARLKKAFGWFVLIMGSLILLEQLTRALR